MPSPLLVLASASPRRKALLQTLVPQFDVLDSTVEDEGSAVTPDVALPPLDLPPGFVITQMDDPRLWAWRKAHDVAMRLAEQPSEAQKLILGADTLVVSRERPLGKPQDRDAARWMLRLLRGTDHVVVTAYALLVTQSGNVGTLSVGSCDTIVVMRAFSEAELEGYVASDEPLDKAGAYALQGEGGRLVDRVEGCATNVIGLPLCATRRLLNDAGVDLLPYPDSGYCAHCPQQGHIGA